MNIFRFWQQITKSSLRLLFLCALVLISTDVFTAQAQAPFQAESLVVPGIDLDVTYISRTPRYNWDEVKQWPAVGETVTFTAQVINKGTNPSGNFGYQWLLDGQIIGSGTAGSIGSQSQAAFNRTWSWQGGRHTITFRVDPQNQIAETAENNNLISDLTDALSVGFWVEQSVYNDFNNKQNGRGTYSWEDWAQYQISTYNELLQRSQLPLAPEGVLARLRLDKIVIVPDSTLFNLGAQHAPFETATDVQWGFSVEEYLNCPWEGCYDISWNVHHELGHYLFGRVDLYALDVQGGDVDVRDGNGNLIAGTSLLPYIAFDVVHYNSRTAVDLMSNHTSDPLFLSDHTVYSLNRDWPMGQRTHNMWNYIYDIPTESKLKVVNNNDQPIPNLQISIYQAVTGDGSSGPYSQYFDNIPDLSGTTNAQGILSLGSAPFGAIQNYWGFTAGDILVKLYNPASGQTRYVWVEAIDFNLAYWRGETTSYTHVIYFPEGQKRMRLSQNQLTFSTLQGSNPPPQKIDVSILGEGADKRWSVPASTVSWLRTIPYANDPSDSFPSGPLSFVIDSATLQPGTYTTQIPVTAESGVLNSSQTVTVTLTVESPNTDVYIGGIKRGSFYVPPQGSIRAGFNNIDSGPVKIVSTNGTDILAALRVIWKEPGFRASYSEMMGLPKEQLSTEYWFPWYNNTDIASMDQGFRIANVDTTTHTIRVFLGNTQVGSDIILNGGGSTRVGYGVNNGPIHIVCVTCNPASTDDKIIAALRVIWQEPGSRFSYSEMMGLPKEQLSNEYWFPWYNNAVPASMDQGFRIANVSSTESNTVEVWVGTTKLDTIALGAGASMRVGYNVDNGPIKVVCTTCTNSGTDKIIAALRVIWKEPGFRASYSEMMGLPKEQLSSQYWFPWYNNAATNSMDQGFRIANISTSESNTVEVWVGSTKLATIPLVAGGSTRVGYNVDNGPIKIICTTCTNTGNDKILAALRVIWKEPGFRASYSEMMGLPNEALSTEYWFPWYNFAAPNSMDQGFRIAVP